MATLTGEQYLERERKAEGKSEYCNGEVRPRPRCNSAHVLIGVDVCAGLNGQMRTRNGFVYDSDMRVHVRRSGLYAYPDVSVVCGEQAFLDDERDTLLNPALIAEILAPETEAYDRGLKFQHYRKLESLRAFLLIASDRFHVELYTRPPSGQWSLTEADGSEGALQLEAIACQLKLADVYEKAALEFSPPPKAG
jgi:Uma2 family endonuclease